MFRYPPLSCRGLCLDDTYQQVVNVSMVQAFQQQVHVKHALIRSVVALTCAPSDIAEASAMSNDTLEWR